ncbi:lipopolysaccharide biosynthesis protein [Neobacillus drentensis]|uniref:lipopolysaccharide biosynthesis protein n=1 Tax=Neobacillus drentensis TaxID=220684 RepID=UPI001F1F21EA|nr:lipopolysaccharide biosynthesis protein [Neobacillus drentensis]ULT56202.1 lipopolysaccharide biosynthesis protein [Neobacillus drentensis]
MKEKNLKNKVVSGLFWTFGEKMMTQGVSFALSIILARLLMPNEYGVIALILVFINLANVFVSTGIGESLIQKKDADETDFSTIFYCSFVISIFLYVILFFTAPFIASFYDNAELLWVLRVLALVIPVSSISTIQEAYVSKNMIFKKFFLSNLGGTLVSGLIGILMAYYGFGIWALVAQYLISTIVGTIILFFTISWRPRLIFSVKSAKELMGFGWKLVVTNLIISLYSELRSLIIGKVYTMSDLAYYNRGNQFPSIIITNINTAISKVVFPAMAEVNDDIMSLKTLTRRAMKITAYLIFPLMIGLMSVANSLIMVLLTEKWLFVVPFLQICCVYWLFQPMQTANWQAIKALGRSDLLMNLEILKKVIGVLILLISMNISVYALAISNAVFAGISMIINMIPNKKLINYSMREQIRDIAPALLLSIAMGGIVYTFSWLSLPAILTLALQIFCGGIIYLGSSYMFKLDSFLYLSDIIIKKLGKNSKLHLRKLKEGESIAREN